MNQPNCVQLCSECPLRTMLPPDVTPETELFLNKVGELTVPSVQIAQDGRFASIEIDYRAGPKIVEIAILAADGTMGPAFYTKNNVWASGVVQAAFEKCDEPKMRRYGFLKLSKQVDCKALDDFID